MCCLGAAVGRFVGEVSAYVFSAKLLINPGGYALAGKQTYYPVNLLHEDYQHCRLTQTIRPL